MQPERPIEKLLRTFAQKRREQARDAFELHPVTRRMLQGEVARRHARGSPSRNVRWQWLARLWPRVALAAASLAVLVVVSLFLFPPAQKPQRTLDVASYESAAPDRVTESLRSAPEAPSAPARRALAEGPSVQRIQADALPSALPPAATPEPRLLLTREPVREERYVGISPQTGAVSARFAAAALSDVPAPSFAPLGSANAPVAEHIPASEGQSLAFVAGVKDTPPVAAPRARAALPTGDPLASQPPREPSTRSSSYGVNLTGSSRDTAESDRFAKFKREAGASSSETRQVTQLMNFTRADLAEADVARRANGGQALLTSFLFEQRGSAVRIVDADGSVYTGAVELAELPAGAMAARPQASFSRPATAQPTAYGGTKLTNALVTEVVQMPPMLSFMVRGTNATLKQGVVFAGSLQSDAAAQAAGTDKRIQTGASRHQITLPAQSPASNPLSNARLTGRVQLANGVELPINALAQPADATK
jgi:hypothetical protein